MKRKHNLLLVALAAYVAGTGLFLAILDKANTQISKLQKSGSSNLEILLNQNGEAIKLFVIAMLLGTLSTLIIVFSIRYAIYRSATATDIILMLIFALVSLILLIWIGILISVPILKMIFSLVSGCVALIYTTDSRR